MSIEHIIWWFWWLLTMTCVFWYCTITIYVAIKGTADIKEMLKRLGETTASERFQSSVKPKP
jgi:hypothetical protein